MNFSEALDKIKSGSFMRRRGWNASNQYVALHKEDPKDEWNFLSFLYIKTVEEQYVPWVASQTDLLANDWEVFVI